MAAAERRASAHDDRKSGTIRLRDIPTAAGLSPKEQELAAGMVRVTHLYRSALKVAVTQMEILDEEFARLYDHSPIHHIEYRIKTLDSIIDKLRRRGLEVSIDNIYAHIQDVAGIRVICFFERDIYQLAESLKKQTDLILVCEKDYIRHPNRTVTGAIILYWEFLFIHWMAWNTIRWKFSSAPFPWISGLPWNTGSAINPSPLMNSK